MSARIDRPSKVLAVADTGRAQTALVTARALAEAHDAELEVVACVEPPHDLAILSRLSGEDPQRLIDAAVAHTRREVGARLAEILPDRPPRFEVLVGKAFFELVGHAAASGCDVLVKTAERLAGLNRFLFASTDQHLLRKCPCPVWLLTPEAATVPRHVLAAVDLDLWDADEPETLADLNRRVLDAACMIARAPEAEVTVLHAWEAMGEGMVWAFAGGRDARMSADRYVNEILDARHDAMDRFVAQVRKEVGPSPRIVPCLARGTPETVIHAQSRRTAADVVVMGTVARTGLSGVFIGNTAENIINRLDCPVLAVKPEGFVSPLLQD
ncbi:universal stress protein [Rhodobacteraceae bacterium CCMM004]|nr:universal stress protein [Rhodobacteraceae bacterium CCMM004]